MKANYIAAVEAIDELLGISIFSAQQIIAKVGTDKFRFSNAHHFCSWAGFSSGNNENAGKRKSSKTNKRNKMLKATKTQYALVASKNKDLFFRAQYQRLVSHRGRKRTVVVVTHSMLIAIYHVLLGKPFIDLGPECYNQSNTQQKTNTYLTKLANLG